MSLVSRISEMSFLLWEARFFTKNQRRRLRGKLKRAARRAGRRLLRAL